MACVALWQGWTTETRLLNKQDRFTTCFKTCETGLLFRVVEWGFKFPLMSKLCRQLHCWLWMYVTSFVSHVTWELTSSLLFLLRPSTKQCRLDVISYVCSSSAWRSWAQAGVWPGNSPVVSLAIKLWSKDLKHLTPENGHPRLQG